MSSEPKEAQSGLSLQTLLISSLSAVAAAVVVPLFWDKGSLIATAVTPIIVALASEALKRPTTAITAVSPRVTRRTGTGAAVRARQPSGVGARGEGPERVARWGGEEDPFGLRTRKRRRIPWKLAVITGVLAAVIGAGAVTASELAIFGHSVTGKDRSTSVFGGRETPAEEEEETPAPTATPDEGTSEEPTAAPTETPTVSPTETPAVAPEATATPAAPTATPTAPTTTATPAPTP